MLILLLAALLAAGEGARPRVYTNDDLERVHPLAAQTGGSSTPATVPGAAARDRQREPGAQKATPGRGEAFWRREKERLEERLQPLHDQVEDLREKIAERERQKGVRPVSDPQLVSLRRRLATLEGRIRDLQFRLDERARREGALPGWLR